MKIVKSEQMALIEDMVINQMGFPTIVLMEHSALRVVDHCMEYLKDIQNPKAVVVAGHGLNGGDGLAIARLLHFKGVKTTIIALTDFSDSPDPAKTNYSLATQLGIPVVSMATAKTYGGVSDLLKFTNVVIDAIFGIGINRTLCDDDIDVINSINKLSPYTISVDIPSGVHPDTGKPMGAAVKADMTISFTLPKLGTVTFPGAQYVGELIVEPVGIPTEIVSSMSIDIEMLTDSLAGQMLPARNKRSSKATFGHVIALAGSDNMPGAAVVCSTAAYKIGAGLVQVVSTPHVADIINNKLPEAITRSLPVAEDGTVTKGSLDIVNEAVQQGTVMMLGPGLGTTPDTIDLVSEIIRTADMPLIIDADALNALTENVAILKDAKHTPVITPHPGEMSRISGIPVPEILEDVVQTAVDFAAKYNVVTLLKDADTIIADPSGRVFINTTGSPAMAKAGSGDVLTGIIGGLIAQGMTAFEAAVLGAYIHGKSGEFMGEQTSLYTVLATDIIGGLSFAINHLKNSI